MNRMLRKLVVPAAGVIVATSGFAFMASNSFSNSSGAGSGTQNVTGYTVADLHYSTSDCATPKVCWLNGTVQRQDASAPDAGSVAVKYNGTGWINCPVGDYTAPNVRSFQCDFRNLGGFNPANLITLTVAASG